MRECCNTLHHAFGNITYSLFQAQSSVLPHRGGVDIQYFTGALDCYRKTVHQLRRQGLWHGFFPAVLRVW